MLWLRGFFSLCIAVGKVGTSLQEVPVILAPALAADPSLCLWTGFIQETATSSQHWSIWYFQVNLAIIFLFLSVNVVTSSKRSRAQAWLSSFSCHGLFFRSVVWDGGKKPKVFPEETWGQTGILENFRGTGNVKAEYLVTLIKKNASSRLKPLL